MILSIFHKLWQQLSNDEQVQACAAFWDPVVEDGGEARSEALHQLSIVTGQTTEQLQRAHNSTLAQWMAQCLHLPSMWYLLGYVLATWLNSRPGSIVKDLARSLAPGTNDAEAPATEEFLRGALNKLKEAHPHRLLAVACLLAFVRLQSLTDLKHLRAAVMAAELDVFGIFKELEPGAADLAIPEPAWFTEVDALLIRTIFAAASGELNSPTSETTEAMIEEFIAMNTSRRQSYFHRGMLHGSFDQPFQFHFAGEDEEKRLWYFCGVLKALHRKGNFSGCLKLLKDQKDLTSALNKKKHIRCGEVVLPLVFETFARFEDFAEAARWLEAHIARLPEADGNRLLREAHEIGLRLLQNGRIVEASAIFTAVTVVTVQPRFAQSATEFLALNDLRMAEVKQYQRDFAVAERMLDLIIHHTNNEQVVETAWADLGLVQGRFQAISEVLPETSHEKSLAKCFALLKGEEQFNQAIKGHGDGATRAHFCLRVINFLKIAKDATPRERLSTEAVGHFTSAISWMLSHQQDYGAAMIAWTKLMLAIALLETNVQASVLEAAQYLDDALSSKLAIPPWVYERALAGAMLLDDATVAERLADSLLGSNLRKTYEILWATEIARSSGAVRGRYLKWLIAEKKMSDAAKCGQFQELLKAALRDGEVEQAKDALFGLERLAIENSVCRKAFKDLLKDSTNYSPAWKSRDAEMRLAGLFELEGDFSGAAEVLTGRIRQLLHEGQEYQVGEAEDLVARIEEYHLPDLNLKEIKRKLTECMPPVAPQSGIDELRAGGEPLRILYVGGNETQKAYEKAIRPELADKYPTLTIDFVYPHWDSSWNKHLESVIRLIPHADVVVLNSLVHTELGERIRAACSSDHPHLSCGGRGKASIKRSILRGVLWARRRKQAILRAKGTNVICPPPTLSEVQ